MPFDETLANRVRAAFDKRSVVFEEKRMMGGLCMMVDGKMCVGIDADRLMVRLDPAIYEHCLNEPGCVVMDFTGKPMRGFVFVDGDGISTAKRLDAWIGKALDYNPRAKASKKSRKAR